MTKPAGTAVAVIRAQQAALADRHSAVADADEVLKEVLAGAHAEMREAASRLDAIEAEIDRVISDQTGSAVATPLGARELARFLVTKQREIAAIVAHANELAHAKSVVLQGLQEQYAVS